jgi:hypothetical protein
MTQAVRIARRRQVNSGALDGLMQARALSAKRLGRLAGVSEPTVLGMRRGTRTGCRLSEQQWLGLADALGVDVDAITWTTGAVVDARTARKAAS